MKKEAVGVAVMTCLFVAVVSLPVHFYNEQVKMEYNRLAMWPFRMQKTSEVLQNAFKKLVITLDVNSKEPLIKGLSKDDVPLVNAIIDHESVDQHDEDIADIRSKCSEVQSSWLTQKKGALAMITAHNYWAAVDRSSEKCSEVNKLSDAQLKMALDKSERQRLYEYVQQKYGSEKLKRLKEVEVILAKN
ncbi:MAG: hypothetical protein FWF46_02275 [Oscillospiraceae bacterium]|nr:hypothetical protein [Oscillospiraceae bacterium]